MTGDETLANLSADTLVCDLFASIPAARDVFARHGYRGCGGPTGPNFEFCVGRTHAEAQRTQS